MNVHRLTLVAPMIFCFVACSDEESSWAGTTSDSAGVKIVSNMDVGLWAPGAEWTFEEETRIGVVEGAPEYQLGEVDGIAVDSRGRIFVLDGLADHIQVYSPEGVYEETLGGPGAGPGELQRPWLLLMGAGDTLLVPDMGNMRVNRYASDGSSVSSFRLEIEGGRLLGYKATNSGIVAEHRRASEYFGSEATETPMDVITLLATDGSITDTAMTFPSGEMLSDGSITVYAPEPVWDLTDDSELVFGINDQYRIGFYSDGQLERIITRPYDPRPVSDGEIEAIMGLMERVWAEAGLSPAQVSQARRAWHFAESFPAFAAVRVGPGGSTWVQHVQPISELDEEELATLGMPVFVGSPEWDVFDSQGRFLGVVTMPSRFTPTVFRGDRVYGVWQDEQDVPYVVRLRVVM